MTFQESIPVAKELAENELKKHFDVDAFLILALVDKLNIDLVPESNVDETITDIQGLFVSYMRNRNLDSMFASFCRLCRNILLRWVLMPIQVHLHKYQAIS